MTAIDMEQAVATVQLLATEADNAAQTYEENGSPYTGLREEAAAMRAILSALRTAQEDSRRLTEAAESVVRDADACNAFDCFVGRDRIAYLRDVLGAVRAPQGGAQP